MCNDELISYKSRMLDMFAELDINELTYIEQWICSQAFKTDLEKKKNFLNSEKMLVKIGHSIKKNMPFNAEMSSENIVPPTIGDQADCNEINTCHVDEFLYDDNEIENLVKQGKLKRHFCVDCNSRNIKELIYISHSMSRQAVQYIFKVLLPQNLENKQILDVGSRLGAVLYGAYHLSNASTIIGIEMNKECCEVQEKIIAKFSMDVNRIKVIHSDVTIRPDIVEKSNIIIINVLDFFVDAQKHKDMWYFFKKHIKKGSYLVCNRCMAETLNSLDMQEEMVDWLNICKPNQLENEIFFDVEDCSELYIYLVK